MRTRTCVVCLFMCACVRRGREEAGNGGIEKGSEGGRERGRGKRVVVILY